MLKTINLFTNQDVSGLNDGSTITSNSFPFDVDLNNVTIEIITSSNLINGGEIGLQLQIAPNGTFNGVWAGLIGPVGMPIDSGISVGYTPFVFSLLTPYTPYIRGLLHAGGAGCAGNVSINIYYR